MVKTLGFNLHNGQHPASLDGQPTRPDCGCSSTGLPRALCGGQGGVTRTCAPTGQRIDRGATVAGSLGRRGCFPIARFTLSKLRAGMSLSWHSRILITE